MGRITVSRGLAEYFSDPKHRAATDEYLDWVTAPYGLSREQLTAWLEGAWIAKKTRQQYGELLLKIFSTVWPQLIHRHIHPDRPPPSHIRDCSTEQAEAIWFSKGLDGLTWLPVVYQTKRQQTHMRYGLVTDVEGRLVLMMDVENPFRIRRLRPAGWRWTEYAGYEYRSTVTLTTATRNLDISELQQAADDAVRAVAEFYVPHRTTQPAA